jgi:hypothetical protein
MAFTYTTIVEQYGAGATGTVRFVLDRQMSNGGDVAGLGAAWIATLDGSGNISQSLPSTLDTGTRTPSGTTDARMKVHEVITGRTDRIYYVQIPTGPGTVDLGSLARTDDSGASTVGLTLPTPVAPLYFFPVSGHSATTNAGMGNGTLRLAPWVVTQRLTIDRMGAEITTVGEAGSRLRLGIYADNGFAYPGALVIDAGQIAGDVVAVTDAAALSLALAPGLYWIGGAIQSAPTTQPTLRITQNWTPPVPIASAGIFGANATLIGYAQSGVTGALPSQFSSTVSGSGSVPRVHVRAA